MAVDQEKRFKDLKKHLAESKQEQTRIQTRLEIAKKNRKEAVSDIKARGYEPKELKTVIAEKKAELDSVYSEIESYLPGADQVAASVEEDDDFDTEESSEEDDDFDYEDDDVRD
ncbi:hypothetical protein ACK8P5_26365 (plasmid) [Paenibacillus sp. EC2-1]|uniref:hypothetical protein n=1 Tax=Paenibacillus sp. EC2-1 TaxID=3388665 RepID=UPI003BEF09B7